MRSALARFRMFGGLDISIFSCLILLSGKISCKSRPMIFSSEKIWMICWVRAFLRTALLIGAHLEDLMNSHWILVSTLTILCCCWSAIKSTLIAHRLLHFWFAQPKSPRAALKLQFANDSNYPNYSNHSLCLRSLLMSFDWMTVAVVAAGNLPKRTTIMSGIRNWVFVYR